MQIQANLGCIINYIRSGTHQTDSGRGRFNGDDLRIKINNLLRTPRGARDRPRYTLQRRTKSIVTPLRPLWMLGYADSTTRLSLRSPPSPLTPRSSPLVLSRSSPPPTSPLSLSISDKFTNI